MFYTPETLIPAYGEQFMENVFYGLYYLSYGFVALTATICLAAFCWMTYRMIKG